MNSRIAELFHEVADLPPEARAEYFRQQGVDGITRREVEALVAFDSGSGTILAREIGEAAERALERMEGGLRCGSYVLGEAIGRGGMGAVYAAERVDGEVAQRAAVKLLRPGMDGLQLRQRFLAERQILAGLSHPNIARLLDAGHRDDGQPFLVMEYVDGQAIDVYTSTFSVREKIRVFLKVCSAVAYLHRNLVVHRDLKPANILVTPEGEPKLLDFGIAKILDWTTDSTVTAMRILTPDFASPEQIDGNTVNTASDIYSAGAVLYRLLTGRSPHRAERGPAESAATPPALKGDLEIILRKALRREPSERYATIDQFAEDLENYLDSRPIRARRGEVAYRLRRFVRRQWLPVGTAALALAGLAAGTVEANRQRAIAQRRFVQVRQLANQLFDIDVEVRRTPGTTKARQLIVDTSLAYLRRLATEARGDPDLALDIGNAYIRVARVQGIPISANLGQMDQAAQNLALAEEFIGSVVAAQPANRAAMLRSAQIAHDRMLLARYNGRYEEALVLARRSAVWMEKYNATAADKPEATAILVSYLNVADQHMRGRLFDDALRLCGRGAELARAYGSRPHLGNFLWVSADVHRMRGELDRALQDIRESVRGLESGGQADQGVTMNVALARIHEANILYEDDGISFGKAEEAVAILARVFKVIDPYVHKDPVDQMARGRLAMAGGDMGKILRRSDPARSLAAFDHTLRHLAEIRDNSSFRRIEVVSLAGSTYPLRRLGRDAEARLRLDAAFQRLSQVNAWPADNVKPGSEVEEALCALAEYEAGRRNVRRAVEIYEDVAKKEMQWGARPDSFLPDALAQSRLYTALAGLYRRLGRAYAAARLEEARLKLWREWESRLPGNGFVARQHAAAAGSSD